VQSARQVVDNLMRGRKAERVGVFDEIWRETLEQWVREGYPTELQSLDEGPESHEPVPPEDHFAFDLCRVGGWFDARPLRGFQEVLEETDEWQVILDGAGATMKRWKHQAGPPHKMHFRMTSREVWERDYRPHLLALERERLDLEGTRAALRRRRAQGFWTFYAHMFIWESMRQSMGDTCMYQSLLLDPDWIHDYNRVHTDFFKAHYGLLFEEAGVPDGIWVHEDLGYKNGLFCSPKVLEELIFPYFKELVAFFHSYDLPVVMHSCGNIEDALPLIVDAGFDALNPMQVSAGCDALRFAEQYGDRLAFVGGLDERVLESGDREHIRREVIRLV